MPNLSAHVSAVAGNGVRCECVPFGFDPSAFEKQDSLSSDYLEEHIPEDKFVIGYAGSIGITNALETVIACAKELAGDNRFFFVFLGGGDRREHFIAAGRRSRGARRWLSTVSPGEYRHQRVAGAGDS